MREKYDLNRFGSIYAYGDTVEDKELLQLASHRFYRWQEEGAGSAAL